MQEKRVILIKQIADVMYEVMPKTRFDQVYDNENYTLTEIIADIKESLKNKSDTKTVEKLSKDLTDLIADVPDEFNTLKKIIDYINLNSKDSEMYKALDKKMDKDALSDDVLDKLKSIYSKNEIDNLLEALEETFTRRVDDYIMITNTSTAPEELENNSLWFQIVDLETMK